MIAPHLWDHFDRERSGVGSSIIQRCPERHSTLFDDAIDRYYIAPKMHRMG